MKMWGFNVNIEKMFIYSHPVPDLINLSMDALTSGATVHWGYK